MIYCGYELQAFPDDQFEDHPIYGKVHATVTPQHTTGGHLLGGNPGLPTAEDALPAEGSDE